MKIALINRIALFAAALALMVGVANADSYWNGGDGYWDVADNWSTADYPQPQDGMGYDGSPSVASYGSVYGTITLTNELTFGDTETFTTLYFGRGNSGGDGFTNTLHITASGGFKTGNFTSSQVGGSGFIDATIINEGIFTHTAGTFGLYGAAANQSQRFVAKDGSVTTINGGQIGSGSDVGTALLEIQGGAFTGNAYFNTYGNGHIKISGGAFTNGATATLYGQHGGLFEVVGAGASIQIGASGGAVNYSTPRGTWKFVLANDAVDPISTVRTCTFNTHLVTDPDGQVTISVDASALTDAAAIDEEYVLIDATAGQISSGRVIEDVDSDYGHLVYDDSADTISYYVDDVYVEVSTTGLRIMVL